MKMTKLMKKAALSESILVEDGMDRAQLILAAKAVVDDLQDMAEKIAKMEADGIMPLLDGIRVQFGPEFADRLSNDAAEALRAAMDAVKQSKEQIGKNIDNMQQIVTGEGPGNDMATGAGLDAEAPEATVTPDEVAEPVAGEEDVADVADEAGEEAGDEEGASSDQDIEDIFGADAPVGRETKESVVARNINMLRESANPDRLLMTNVMARMKAGATGTQAVTETARSFGVDVDDVMDVVRTFTKK